MKFFLDLINTINDSIRRWDYFINWDKVIGNIKDLEIDLNILNYLIGKENIEEAFSYLLRKQPQIVRLIPVLLASRDHEFKILIDFSVGTLKYEDFTFRDTNNLSEAEISKAIRFARETGLLGLFANKKIKNIVDYTLGVEVGLDTNGRKNRGGTAMEKIVETYVKRLCNRYSFTYIKEATAEKVLKKWKLNLSVDKASRRLDFAVYNGTTLYLIETNFYGGGGSKLKSTAGEYKSLYDFLINDGHKFIWITDGLGWRVTRRPLEETFNHIDYLLNLNMLTNGLLDDIIVNNL
ncbi:MAG: type II restriction endonuclease [Thermodesulfobacteriota bacterium]|nr:type II restriction endonuclease [Thermodesulfobacteriota bacterium]